MNTKEKNQKKEYLPPKFKLLSIIVVTMVFTLVGTSSIFATSNNGRSSQDHAVITGRVMDNTGVPVTGATVVKKGTQIGTVTDVDGNYSINAIAGDVLIFSFVGMSSKEITLGDKHVYNVTLESEAIGLDEVVAIGYGTAKKSDLTGSVGVAKGSDLLKTPSFNPVAGLTGKVAGVNVFSNSGAPDGSSRVIIRGVGTINASSQPLYVVDGVAMEEFDNSNPNIIERIEVLKDASATAIYGARGANGVILVTTKGGGTTSDLTVSYDGYVSVGQMRKKMDVLNSQQFLDVIKTGMDNAKNIYGYTGPLAFTTNDPRLFNADGSPKYDTDWQKESTRTAVSHNHQISIQQGGKKSSFGAFINYSDNEGIMLNSYSKRISGKMTFNANPKKWVTLGMNLTTSRTEANQVEEGGGGQVPRRSMIEMAPIFPVKFPDGSWSNSSMITDNIGLEGIENPVHVLETQQRLKYKTQIFGNMSATFHLNDKLDLKTQYGIDYHLDQDRYYAPNDLNNISAPLGRAHLGTFESNYWQEETYLTYKNDWGKHHLTAMGGLSFQEKNYFYNQFQVEGFSDNYYEFYNVGAGTKPGAPESGYYKWTMASQYTRFSYNYDQKYLATLTMRRDGSSRFGEKNKYGYFPSIGLGWNISQEPFMKDVTFVNQLKLRTSWGLTGNTEIGTYKSLAPYESGTTLIDGERASTQWTSRLANPNLKWEKTRQVDVGITASIWDQKLSFDVDYYHKLTKDLLLDRPVPYSSGYTSVLDNIGSVSNQGIEFMVKSRNISRPNFTWQTTFNTTYNKNRIESLGTNNEDIFPGPYWVSGSQTILRVGESFGSFWGQKRLGTWSTEEVAALVAQGNSNPPVAGTAKRSDESMVLGKGMPDWTGSLINTLTYKNFDFTLDIQFSEGADIMQEFMHSTEDRTGYANSLTTVLGGWTPTNQNTMIQQIRNAPATGQSTGVDSHWVVNGSYIRGNGMTVGYTFNDLKSKWKIKNLRLYGTLNNFFVINSKDFKGYDPEATSWTGDGDTQAQNIFFFQYPKPTTFTLGLNLKF